MVSVLNNHNSQEAHHPNEAYRTALDQFRRAAAYVRLPEDVRRISPLPRREFTVNFPFGGIQVRLKCSPVIACIIILRSVLQRAGFVTPLTSH
jgi:hypothetical protein